ncbi:MAG: hypothetical protein AABW57_02515 [Nanoarchaeota archaeon]
MKKENIAIYLIIVAVILTVFNQFQILSLNKYLESDSSTNNLATGLATGVKTVNALDVIPKGVPNIYGKEIGIKYDDVSVNDLQKAESTISKLALFDNTINLEGGLLQRYIGITNSISCEYCCGAQAITFSDGQAACSCAHSYAMRGLAKYLLTKHPEISDDEILNELGKWKTLFFPDSINAKAQILKESNIELNYINLASNKYRGIEQGNVQGSMVGGC